MSAKTDYYGNPLQAITDIGQHQAALEEVERLKAINADLLAALEYAFIGFSAAPKSLGYEITHIATIRAAIAKARGIDTKSPV